MVGRKATRFRSGAMAAVDQLLLLAAVLGGLATGNWFFFRPAHSPGNSATVGPKTGLGADTAVNGCASPSI